MNPVTVPKLLLMTATLAVLLTTSLAGRIIYITNENGEIEVFKLKPIEDEGRDLGK